MKQLSITQKDLYERAAKGYRRLTGRNLAVNTVFGLLAAVDPTKEGKYMRWLCERLADNSARKETDRWDIEKGKASQITRTLRAFHMTKRLMPEEQRNILNYYGIKELEAEIRDLDRDRECLNRGMLEIMSMENVYQGTLVAEAAGISVHYPRNIEEAAILLCNPDLLDARGQGLYKALRSDGEVVIFISPGNVLIGAITPEGSRSLVFDCMGEHAVFEDMLSEVSNFGSLDWNAHKAVLKPMVQIDPMLPFDMAMDDVEPYQIALVQFPLVLLEGREIPDELREVILSDETVQKAVAGIE